MSTGGTTLAVTDLRRGVLVKSEDQEEELLSSVFVGGLPHKPGRTKGEKVLVGGATGVLTLWERGVWDDQDERIVVDYGVGRGGGESLDALAIVPDGVGGFGKHVAVGVADGTVRIVRLGVNKVVGEALRHDELEGVVAVGFDVEGRMISGGGRIVKVWQEGNGDGEDEGEDEDEEDDDEDSDDGDSDDSEVEGPKPGKREVSDSDDSSEDEDRHRKKKGKKGKGKEPYQNGILGFKGLD